MTIIPANELPRRRVPRNQQLSPLTLDPFPLEGAREGVASYVFPAPIGGRMSLSDRKGQSDIERKSDPKFHNPGVELRGILLIK